MPKHTKHETEDAARLIIDIIRERPRTLTEIASLTDRTIAATRVLIDTMSLDTPIYQEGKLYGYLDFSKDSVTREASAPKAAVAEYTEAAPCGRADPCEDCGRGAQCLFDAV
jgi:hypothetical protein